jgi:hypothetical protein
MTEAKVWSAINPVPGSTYPQARRSVPTIMQSVKQTVSEKERSRFIPSLSMRERPLQPTRDGAMCSECERQKTGPSWMRHKLLKKVARRRIYLSRCPQPLLSSKTASG